MNTTTVLSLINNPVTMALLGSSMGWMFVSYVWKPYTSKNVVKNKAKRYKKEALFRLAELTSCLENRYSINLIINLLEGNTSLNPEFKSWKLDTLILSGWSEYAYKNIHKTLEALVTIVEESNTTIDKEKTKKGLLLLDTIAIYLKNIQEN